MYKYTILFLLIAGINSVLSHEKILHKKETHHHRFLKHQHHELKHAAVAHRLYHHNRHAFHHRSANQSSSNGLIELFYNETSQFLSFFNKSSNVLSIFDSKSSLALLQNNSNSSIVYIIDTVTKSVYQEGNKTVENLINNSSQLQDLIKSGQITNLTQINQALSQLGLNSNGLNTFNNISKSLNKLNSLNLTGILFKEQNQSSFQDGLEKFSGAVSSILTIFNQISNNGNLRNNSINLPSILNSSNGVDALSKILQNLTSQNNNSSLSNLTSYLEDGEVVLELVIQLAGTTSKSAVDIIMELISSFQSLSSGKSNVEDLIKTLLDVANKTQNLITDDIKTTTDKLSKLNKNTGILSNFTKLLKDIESNNLTISGVDVSKLWQMITSGNSTNAVEIVEKLISQLGNYLSPFLSQLNNTISSIPGLSGLYQSALGGLQNVNKTILQLIPNQDSSEVTSEPTSGTQDTPTLILGQKKSVKSHYRSFKHMKNYRIQSKKEDAPKFSAKIK